MGRLILIRIWSSFGGHTFIGSGSGGNHVGYGHTYPTAWTAKLQVNGDGQILTIHGSITNICLSEIMLGLDILDMVAPIAEF